MIVLEHIHASFGRRAVLEDIDCTLPSGRVTALMGPNGCGKTTLLRCMGGLLLPSAGRVLIDDDDVATLPARAMAQRAAYVRQHAVTDFDFSAFEVVLMGRNPYQRRLQNESEGDWAIVEDCMKQTGTWHLRFARPAEMSGGELQRVMIARALAQTTPLLLMDEPVSNLDIAHQIETMRLLRSLGKTVVIVLHDLNLALRYCDDLMLLKDGKLLFHGETGEGLTTERIMAVYGVASLREENHIVYDY